VFDLRLCERVLVRLPAIDQYDPRKIVQARHRNDVLMALEGDPKVPLPGVSHDIAHQVTGVSAGDLSIQMITARADPQSEFVNYLSQFHGALRS
jgi:hypothetical protein